jgi:hypothetical protein
MLYSNECDLYSCCKPSLEFFVIQNVTQQNQTSSYIYRISFGEVVCIIQSTVSSCYITSRTQLVLYSISSMRYIVIICNTTTLGRETRSVTVP